MKNKIRTLIVDDHEMVIVGVKLLLSKFKDIDCIGDALTGEQAKDKIKELLPDVVIIDIYLPDISGLQVAKYITKYYPDINILFHTLSVDKADILNAFEVGALGYVPKNFNAKDLIEAIRTVFHGKKYIKGVVSDVFVESYFKVKEEEKIKNNIPLSEREIEILKYTTSGKTDAQVADKLGVSIRTVEVHKANIRRKLNINNMAGLVKYAIRNNIINL